AEFALGAVEALRDFVQRIVPADARELTRSLGADAELRIREPVGMMNSLRVAGDLGADHTGGVALQLGTSDTTDGRTVDHLDIEGAGRRAIVRAGGMPDVDLGALVHASIAITKSGDRRGHLSGNPSANRVFAMR